MCWLIISLGGTKTLSKVSATLSLANNRLAINWPGEMFLSLQQQPCLSPISGIGKLILMLIPAVRWCSFRGKRWLELGLWECDMSKAKLFKVKEKRSGRWSNGIWQRIYFRGKWILQKLRIYQQVVRCCTNLNGKSGKVNKLIKTLQEKNYHFPCVLYSHHQCYMYYHGQKG